MPEQIVCPTCQRRYTIKPELAGKKAKCKCGERIVFPAAVPGGTQAPSAPPKSSVFEPIDPSGGSYDVAGDMPAPPPLPAGAADTPACGNCRKPMAPGAVICTACGFNQKTRSIMKTQVLKEPAAVKPKKTAAASSSVSNYEPLSGFDWLLIIFCSGIAFCVGLVRGIRGKGWDMMIAALVVGTIISGIKIAIMFMSGGVNAK